MSSINNWACNTSTLMHGCRFSIRWRGWTQLQEVEVKCCLFLLHINTNQDKAKHINHEK
jgi:hypothetical protein